ncbi:MAG: NAD-glutamate dehydrogenase [bacterium]
MTDRADASHGAFPAEPPSTETILGKVAPGVLGDAESARCFLALLLGERFAQRHRGIDPNRLQRAVDEDQRLLADPPGAVGRACVSEPGVDSVFPDCAVLRTHTRDVPYLVESLRQLLDERGFTPRLVLHPIFGVDRNAAGRVRSIRPASTEPDTARHESLIHIEAEGSTAQARAELERAALDVLTAAHAASADRDAIRHRMAGLIATEIGLPESAPPPGPNLMPAETVVDFLRWLLDDNFVFLGARTYESVAVDGTLCAAVRRGSGLGLLADDASSAFAKPRAIHELDPEVRARVLLERRLVLDKTNRSSPIHRRVPMDAVSLRFFDAGRFAREERFVGLYTRKALFEQPTAIPILRTKHRRMLDRAGVIEGSFDERELTALFNALPKEELFLNDPDAILSGIRTLLDAYAQDTLKLVLRPTFSGRLLAIGMALPDRYFSAEGLDAVVAHLEQRLGSSVLERRETRGEPGFRQVYLYAAARPGAAAPDPAALEAEVLALVKPWPERLTDALPSELDPIWERAFPDAYQDLVPVSRAVADVTLLASLADDQPFAIGAVHPGDPDGGDPTATLLRIAHRQPLTLGRMMPVLHNLALEVIDEAAFRVTPAGRAPLHLHVFRVRGRKGELLDPGVVDAAVLEGLARVLEGRSENDPLNGLMTAAGLSWRQVWIVRAYVHHAFQLGLFPSRATAAASLVGQASLARSLVRWFETRFDPDSPDAERRAAESEIGAELARAIEALEDPTDYKVFKALRDLVAATVRTNHFRAPGERSRALALKLEPATLAGVPRPAPKHEIFVQAPGMEGVHLRGGDVARGGIRFSDRPDDYRTEILGLMKTQMVKNAIIVPVGAKGGFILTAPPADRKALADAALEAYRTFIGALLDVTDDRDGERVVPPERVVRLDRDDPYLVVAADKGTAAYSDVANAIAIERGFWLGDAFASGGSRGYDHKKLGITARGAWECAKTSFWELGLDPERDPITVVGIGDPSGDVFGNGLLRSRTLLLVGAFNHRHVFLDPNPDPERSFRERERCFQAALGWDGYDVATVSAGGGVFARRSRAIPIPAGLRPLLGTDRDTASGEELIRLLLTAKVDLLSNGGIGTYVKASTESNADVGDKTNDAVRVDASQLRCKVVAEGGNLGFTQAARCELAALGGRIHTDAIDNSGGVDCSDHEVNLKIALATARARGEIDLAAETQALVDATEEVCEQVLEDNRLQSLVLAYDQRRSRALFDVYQDMIGRLAATGHLDAEREGFAKRELKNQRGEGHGFFKPQLAVLLAHEKRRIYDALIRGSLIDRPALSSLLTGYFPPSVERSIPRAVAAHPLRREIVATALSNRVVNRSGLTMVSELEAASGADVETVVGAWFVAVAVLGADELAERIAALRSASPRLDAATVLALVERVNRRLASAVSWNVARGRCVLPIADELAATRARAAAHARSVASLRSAEESEVRARETESLRAAGIPGEVIDALATFDDLASFFVIEALTQDTGASSELALSVHTSVDAGLRLGDLRAFVERTPVADPWDRQAARRILDQLESARFRIAARLLAGAPPRTVEGLVRDPRPAVRFYLDAIERLRAIGSPRNLHPAFLAVQALQELAAE